MKTEAWIFGITTIFVALVTPSYWFVTEDWTGTSALTMTGLLVLMCTIYLANTARRLGARPEDLPEAEIADGAGELGFFPPYSWWPLWCALALAVMVVGIVFGWWLFIIGCIAGVLALCGFVYEFYRGEHAH